MYKTLLDSQKSVLDTSGETSIFETFRDPGEVRVEKGVDVAIATKLIELAYRNRATDLVPGRAPRGVDAELILSRAVFWSVTGVSTAWMVLTRVEVA